MHLGCYGRGGPLSPCANSRHVRSENHRHRRHVRVNWWRAFILPTRGHVSIRVARVFRTSARGGHNFCVVPHSNGQSCGWPLWARTGCIQTGTAVFGRVSVRSFEICATCRCGCLPFLAECGLEYRGGAHWEDTSHKQINGRSRRRSVHHQTRTA